MVVRTLGCGRDVAGLHIGLRNARRHFPRGLQHVELQLGHLHIYCDLTPDFWQSRPVICDPRLSDWLYSRIFHGKTSRAPAPVAVVPLGSGAFSVMPYALPAISGNGLARIGPVAPPLNRPKTSRAAPPLSADTERY